MKGSLAVWQCPSRGPGRRRRFQASQAPAGAFLLEGVTGLPAAPAFPAPRDAERATFRDFLARRQLRVTNQRLAILDAALDHPGHYTAEELLDRARQIDRSVSRATVYRTLPILTESALVREVDVGRDMKFYHANRGNKVEQAEVICLDCDRITTVDAPFLSWYANSHASRLGLTVEDHRLQVRGRCARLAKTGTCPDRVHAR